MILTYKVKHNRDLSAELVKARKIAQFAIEHRTISSKDVKHIGLKSIIANQILRKYSRNKNAKKVHKVKLTIPSQGIKFSHEKREIWIPSLKLRFEYFFRNDFEKINQIELDNTFAYVSVTVPEKATIEPSGYIGVDRNATSHIAVVGNPITGKVMRLGKKAEHIHKKYRDIRRRLQAKKKYNKLKKIKKRERNILRDLNHKVAKKIVQEAKNSGMGIKLEKLDGIRNAETGNAFRYSLNSWSFYQLEKMIEYKARLLGVPVVYVDSRYTSKECSRCGHIGNRIGKSFKCPNCGHVDHADANASFNIALRPPLVEGEGRLHADRDACNGSTDTPKEATLGTTETLEPPTL